MQAALSNTSVSYPKQLVLDLAGQNQKNGLRYVGMQLKSMGYEVEYQPFQVPDQYVGFIESPLSTKRNWQAGAAPNALISTESVTAPLIFVQGGTKLEDIPNEVNGKIVLFERGTTVADYNKQVENAVSKGAKGVLLYSLIGGRGNYGQTFNPRLTKSNLSLSSVLLMRKEMHLKKKSLKRNNNSFPKSET